MIEMSAHTRSAHTRSASARGGLRQPLPVSCFSVVASAEPDVMPRVLQVFAKRGLVPSQWYSTVAGATGRDLHIDFQVAGLEASLREQIAESLRQMINIELVLTSEKRLAQSA